MLGRPELFIPRKVSPSLGLASASWVLGSQASTFYSFHQLVLQVHPVLTLPAARPWGPWWGSSLFYTWGHRGGRVAVLMVPFSGCPLKVTYLDRYFQHAGTCSQLCSEFEASLVYMKPCLQNSPNNKIKARFIGLVKHPAGLGHAVLLSLP